MFFVLPNNVAYDVSTLETPWTFTPAVPEAVAASKEKFRIWCASPSTVHAFLSLCEGRVPSKRVSDANPVEFMHGIIADYDAPCSEDMLESIKRQPRSDYAPSWWCRTFSNHHRFFWLFEKPVYLGNSQLARNFLKVVQKKVRPDKYLAALDAQFCNPHLYYEIGSKWETLEQPPIPSIFVNEWLAEAGQTQSLVDDSLLDIPLARIAEEVQEKFPGRWEGPFEEGKLGIRFWDPEADHPTGCVVRKWGMQVFTRGGHKSWRDIFGDSFVEKFEAERVGPVMDSSYYDGDRFWRWDEVDKTFRWSSKEDFGQWLRLCGFSSLKIKGSTFSQVDRVENLVKERKRVARALPFVHQPQGLIRSNGDIILNIATAKCLEPAPPGSVTDLIHGKNERFPWLYNYLVNFFDPQEQLQFFLAWLQRFYRGGLNLEPEQGQAVVIAGPAEIGKTFLSSGLVANLVGGMSDGSAALVDGSEFTAEVAEKPLLCIDDDQGGADNRAHLKFSTLVKKVVANTKMRWNQKHLAAGLVDWRGRVMINCNLDSVSLRLIPSLEVSTIDKIMLFRTADTLRTFSFCDRKENERRLARELPFFARWLLDWQVPEHLIDRTRPRYGIRRYHHPSLFQLAMQAAPSHHFLEVLMDFLQAYQQVNPDKTVWTGTSNQLCREMHIAFAGQREVLKKYDGGYVGSLLGQLVSRGYTIGSEEKRLSGVRVWTIPFVLEQRFNGSEDPEPQHIDSGVLPQQLPGRPES
jgi:hypothetical protein